MRRAVLLASFSVMLGVMQPAGVFAQGEHARRAAAELRLVLGDAQKLANRRGLSKLHATGLQSRIAGSLSGLALLLRLADQETGRETAATQGAIQYMRLLLQSASWAGMVSVSQDLSRSYPLNVPMVSAGPKRAKAIHDELCAACHDEPDLEVERPAYDLFKQAKSQSETEFLARLIIGVRGDRVTGYSNPLTAPELKALLDYYRTTIP
ncbi:MAG: hypothetical protein HKN11_04805 [Rhizobiales bacterium]|nr:hypothetical protein [Hyphomicrobiales bacterium]